jgi:hypothetical protein
MRLRIRPHFRDPQFVQRPDGLIVPKEKPKRVGLGCTKHDDHFLVSPITVNSDESKDFLRKHRECAPYDCLEEWECGVVVVGQTGNV